LNGLRLKGMNGSTEPVYLRLVSAVPTLIAIALLIVMGVMAARLTWTLWVGPVKPSVTADRLSASAAKTTSPSALATRLADLAPFGRAERQAGASPEKGPVRTSHLALRLEGVISGTGRPLAIIRVGGQVKVFQVGDRVTGNAYLHAIEPMRVLLENNGHLESVKLPRSQGNPLSGQPPTAGILSGGPSSGNLPPVQQFLDKPQKLLDYVSFMPVRRNGKVYGYRLRARSGQVNLLPRLGLSSGDIITRVNGKALSDPAVLAQVLPALRSGRPVRAQVMHDGKPTEVTIDLSNIR